MRIIELAVSRGRVTILAAFLLGLLGIQAYLSIPRSVDPHFPSPFAFTTVFLPGADAKEMEESVAKPIEQALQGLDQVREIRSISTDGSTRVVAEFEHGTDAELTLDRVIRQVNAIRGQLPAGISAIEFTRPRTSEAAVLQVALVSESANWRRIIKYSDDLRDRLSAVPNVRRVSVDGAARPEVTVALDSARLAALGLPPEQVTEAVQRGGIRLPGGSVASDERRYNVEAGGAYRSLDDVRSIPLRAENGRIVRIADIATVEWSEAELLHVARFNDRRAVFVSIRQKDGSDIELLRDEATREIEKFRNELPPDMSLHIGFDQSRDIDLKLKTLQRDFFIALALVLITLAPLGRRASLIVMVSIPLSLAAGVLVLWTLGHSLNQISLSGLIVSLGLIVDDSIVVIENIERKLRDGMAPFDAAIDGARGISAAVVGATAVLLMAFIPIAMLPEAAGDFVRGLPIAVIATVVSSLFVSMTIIPFLASRTAKREGSSANALFGLINRGIQKFYTPLLRRALSRPRRWVLGSLGLCAASFGLIPVIGFSLFPEAEAPYFLVRVETPQGSSLAATDAVVRRVSEALKERPEVANRMANSGAANPQVFYNTVPAPPSIRAGEIFVTLKEWDSRKTPQLLVQLQNQFRDDPDAQLTVVAFDNGPPISAPIAIRLSGPNLLELRRLAAQTAQTLREVPGLRDVNNPIAGELLNLHLRLDREQAVLLGVPEDAARRALRLAIEGQNAGLLVDEEGDSWPVTMRLTRGANPGLEVLQDVFVTSSAGASVPLRQITSQELRSEPTQIYRRSFERAVTVTARVQPGQNVADATDRVTDRLDEIEFPSGYRMSLGGNAEAAQRNFSGLWSIALLSLFGILFVLVLEFGRFREAFVVAGVVPLGFLGGLLALLLTGNSLSFLAAIGFIALAGIEVKNSILLVDFAGRQRAAGFSPREAIERAGDLRFLPVLLTSLTAIGGLLPLAIGGSTLYSPLAWVIIGGLTSSTLLSRFITPAMYLLLIDEDRG